MQGTVAITDHGWYQFLLAQSGLDEINFWTPSAYWGFKAEPGSPFFFKLKKKYGNAICGFAHFAHFTRLPDYLAWELFDIKNGCATFMEMRARINKIRLSMNYRSEGSIEQIGCILLVQPVFFQESEFILPPSNWPPANLRNKKYDLEEGEGKRIWMECLARVSSKPSSPEQHASKQPTIHPGGHGTPTIIQPRLGQGSFRASVLDAYGRACAVTTEHSLPALEASHIKPFSENGPHDVRNGILLRADLHRLFDQGYVTITTDHRMEVSPALKSDFSNGKTYYPLHGQPIHMPDNSVLAPAKEFIEWHNENVWKAA